MKNIAWIVLISISCCRLRAATLYVDLNNAAPVAPFDSWATAATNIQDAVNAAMAGDTIRIADGHYLLASEISVTNAVTIRSENGLESTIVDGQDSVRCFNLGNSACVIEGLTITNGYTSDSGGGVYCADTTSVVTNCTISGNSAASFGFGGGMSDGTANNCTISGNEACYGGGMCCGMANNCTISGNSAEYGGGLYIGTADNCTISGNAANSDGGGLYYGTASNCTISGNSAYNGGGLYSHEVYSSTADNCTISGNSADYAGGGMYYGAANNCTISGNKVNNRGGGMYYGTANNCTISGNSSVMWGGGMTLGVANNCVVWNNAAIAEKNLNYTTARFTCSPDVTHGVDGCITNAPGFIDAVSGNYRLMSNSPCINWGDNSYVSGTLDLDGQPRIVGDYVDMGAYEHPEPIMPDRDEDGMPDDWERSMFGFNIDPAGNPDGDALSNLKEYIAGTDPTDPASYFAVTNASPSPCGFVVEWPAVEGREYAVLRRTSMTNASEVLKDDLAYPQSSYTDTVHAAESAGFYRVEVRMP